MQVSRIIPPLLVVKFGMFSLRQTLKVFKTVVRLIAVDVMDYIPFGNRADEIGIQKVGTKNSLKGISTVRLADSS